MQHYAAEPRQACDEALEREARVAGTRLWRFTGAAAKYLLHLASLHITASLKGVAVYRSMYVVLVPLDHY